MTTIQQIENVLAILAKTGSKVSQRQTLAALDDIEEAVFALQEILDEERPRERLQMLADARAAMRRAG